MAILWPVKAAGQRLDRSKIWVEEDPRRRSQRTTGAVVSADFLQQDTFHDDASASLLDNTTILRSTGLSSHYPGLLLMLLLLRLSALFLLTLSVESHFSLFE